MAQPPPNLNIPPSTSTVRVQIIDTTSHISNVVIEPFLTPPIKGHDALNCPSYSFLISHPGSPSNPTPRRLLFDLGVRKDWQTLPPQISTHLIHGPWNIAVEKDVPEILLENNISPSSIEGIIWSHWHWDHTGDPSLFPSSTTLIVGPGFSTSFIPGYPSNPTGVILESDYTGRRVHELSFSSSLKIGTFAAHDYFNDGSFYILDSPGHAIGHLCALARITSSTASFVFMGGDVCHHNGEFRPSAYKPLPEIISPHPFPSSTSAQVTCPGSLFEHLLDKGDRSKPFYRLKRNADGSAGMADDGDEAERTIGKVMEVDANEEVLVVMAHDDSLLDIVDFFPKDVEGFVENGWVGKGRWAFLRDFKDAVNI